jgi:hypothetical protein
MARVLALCGATTRCDGGEGRVPSAGRLDRATVESMAGEGGFVLLVDLGGVLFDFEDEHSCLRDDLFITQYLSKTAVSWSKTPPVGRSLTATDDANPAGVDHVPAQRHNDMRPPQSSSADTTDRCGRFFGRYGAGSFSVASMR